jgi:hypothetical protein
VLLQLRVDRKVGGCESGGTEIDLFAVCLVPVVESRERVKVEARGERR